MSKQFVKFHAGDFSLEDAPWSGRPVEVDSIQINTLVENNQCSIIQEIADTLKISKSIKLLVKMKNVFYFTEKTKQDFFVQPKTTIHTNTIQQYHCYVLTQEIRKHYTHGKNCT